MPGYRPSVFLGLWPLGLALGAAALGACGHRGGSTSQVSAGQAAAATAAGQQALGAAQAGPAALAATQELAQATAALQIAQAKLRAGDTSGAQACSYVACRRAQRAAAQGRLRLAQARAEVAQAVATGALDIAPGARPSPAAAGATRPALRARPAAPGSPAWRHAPGRGLVLRLPIASLFEPDPDPDADADANLARTAPGRGPALSARGQAQVGQLRRALRVAGVRAIAVAGSAAWAPHSRAVAVALAGPDLDARLAPQAPAAAFGPHLELWVIDDDDRATR